MSVIWEYKVIEKFDAGRPADAVHQLNGWGRKGWELVSVVYDYQRDKYVLYLKRRVS